MKKLTTKGVEMLEDFIAYYNKYGCTCHQSPPCSACVHEGNPINLEENNEVWNSVSTQKFGSSWFASYDNKKVNSTISMGKGKTEQEAIDNLPFEELL